MELLRILLAAMAGTSGLVACACLLVSSGGHSGDVGTAELMILPAAFFGVVAALLGLIAWLV